MSSAPRSEAPRANGAGFADAALALLLFVGALLLYGCGFRASLFDDGEVFSHYFVASDSQVWYHVVYLPAARALHALLAPLGSADHLLGLKALSVASAALGLACTFAASRSLGCARGPALVATLCLALSPCLWFFATTIELHATHFASVAFAAAGILAARRWPFAAHLALAALLFPLLYLTHNSGAIYGLGYVALFALARVRGGERFSLARTLFVVGPVLLASLLLVIASCNAWRSLGWTLGLGGTFAYIDSWHAGRAVDLVFLRDELLIAEGALWLLLLRALLARAVPKEELLAALLAALPVAGFFLWFAFPSRGGYFSGIAFFLALLAARCPWPRAPLGAGLVAALLLGAQGWLGARELQRYEERFASSDDGGERARAVRVALGPRLGAKRAALLAFEPRLRPIQLDLRGCVEIPLHHRVPAFLGPPIDAAGFSGAVLQQVEEHLASGEWLVCYERMADESLAAWPAEVRELIQGFEGEVRARFAVEELRVEERGFWRLELRSPP
ncbi:MAG: hypothetical protein IPN34_07520 [Planctomycetes bacterium]|nr:hypothetical protein [Planctomycetota bacterium]